VQINRALLCYDAILWCDAYCRKAIATANRCGIASLCKLPWEGKGNWKIKSNEIEKEMVKFLTLTSDDDERTPMNEIRQRWDQCEDELVSVTKGKAAKLTSPVFCFFLFIRLDFILFDLGFWIFFIFYFY
jgi:hypothetical protein